MELQAGMNIQQPTRTSSPNADTTVRINGRGSFKEATNAGHCNARHCSENYPRICGCDDKNLRTKVGGDICAHFRKQINTAAYKK